MCVATSVRSMLHAGHSLLGVLCKLAVMLSLLLRCVALQSLQRESTSQLDLLRQDVEAKSSSAGSLACSFAIWRPSCTQRCQSYGDFYVDQPVEAMQIRIVLLPCMCPATFLGCVVPMRVALFAYDVLLLDWCHPAAAAAACSAPAGGVGQG
jgi:hypothetical protein